MNGVEILHTQLVYDCLISPIWALVCLAAIVIISAIGALTVDYHKVQTVLKVLVVIAVAMLIVCIIGAFIKTDVVATHHMVIISDDVNMNKFLDKYEILDQEGKIYTVKERE